MRFFAILIASVLAAGCGPVTRNERSGPPASYAPENPSDVVVIGTATFDVAVGDRQLRLASTYPVVVTLAANTTFTIDTSAFVVPVMSNAVLDFGSIAVTAATTNKLKLCGAGGNQKCTHALLRIYTTVAAGAGFWNADGYGAPMSAGLSGSPQTVPLSQVSAITVHSYTIPGNRNTVRVSDFSPSPIFLFGGDFTDAGEGSYSTTINVEFALAP